MLHPGDRLLLVASGVLTNEQAHRLMSAVTEGLPGVEVVVISGCRAVIARRAALGEDQG